MSESNLEKLSKLSRIHGYLSAADSVRLNGVYIAEESNVYGDIKDEDGLEGFWVDFTYGDFSYVAFSSDDLLAAEFADSGSITIKDASGETYILESMTLVPTVSMGM